MEGISLERNASSIESTLANPPTSKIEGREVTDITSNQMSKSFISPKAKMMLKCAALIALTIPATFAALLLLWTMVIGTSFVLPAILGSVTLLASTLMFSAAKCTSIMSKFEEAKKSEKIGM